MRVVPESLTRLLRTILPKATAEEIADAAERLRSLVESGAAWVGDTAGGAARKLEDALLGREAAPTPRRLTREEAARLWSTVVATVEPRVRAIEDATRAVHEDPDAPDALKALARDVDWLVAELRAAWEREVTLRVALAAAPSAAPPATTQES